MMTEAVHSPVPPLTAAAISYSWQELARRAGVGSLPASDKGIGISGVHVCYCPLSQAESEGPRIIVVPCRDAAWRYLLDRKPNTLDWRSKSQLLPDDAQRAFDEVLPVLFWGAGYEDGSKPFVERLEDGSVVFNTDIIAATFFMLSRWEETVLPIRDEHERFPGAASVAYRQGFLGRPVVDEYALILRDWLKVLLPRWEPKKHRFSVKLSHDVDRIGQFPNWRRAIRTFGGDLLKRRSATRARRTIREALAQAAHPDRAIYLEGIWMLAALSREYGIHDEAFYFIAADPGPLDGDYQVESEEVRRCITDLQQMGCEVGIHASYDAFDNPERLAAEKARLDALLGMTAYGGRQHFLRFRVPDTWRHWAQAGLAYDATMTYADHEGFRCGTCHPFRPFDLEQNRELEVWEHPLIVMDGTLRDYRGLTLQQGEARILELARRCKRVEGTFTLLWHNSSLHWDWSPWAAMYERVIRSLSPDAAK